MHVSKKKYLQEFGDSAIQARECYLSLLMFGAVVVFGALWMYSILVGPCKMHLWDCDCGVLACLHVWMGSRVLDVVCSIDSQWHLSMIVLHLG